MYIEKLASQIRNDVVSGLRGYHTNLSLNLNQLQDEIVACRLNIIKQYVLKGIFPIKDLMMSINCVDVDCKSLERCPCNEEDPTMMPHFEIPQVISDFGKQAILYIGSTDRKREFTLITSLSELQTKKYRKRGSNKPYVWVDYTPNSNGMLDCFLFNAPLLHQVSVIGLFKDPRQLNKYNCCNNESLEGSDTNFSFIDKLVKDQLTKEKIYYYRQLQPANLPNDQQYIT